VGHKEWAGFRSNNFHIERRSFFTKFSVVIKSQVSSFRNWEFFLENYSHSGSRSNKPGQGRIPKLANTGMSESNTGMLYRNDLVQSEHIIYRKKQLRRLVKKLLQTDAPLKSLEKECRNLSMKFILIILVFLSFCSSFWYKRPKHLKFGLDM
jgi:hypothetical protein